MQLCNVTKTLTWDKSRRPIFVRCDTNKRIGDGQPNTYFALYILFVTHSSTDKDAMLWSMHKYIVRSLWPNAIVVLETLQ